MIKLAACVLLAFAIDPLCEGPTAPSYDSNDEAITGQWNWVESVGGIAGITVTPESSGRTELLVFENNNTMKNYVNGGLTETNTYSLGEDLTIFSADSLPVIYRDDGFVFAYVFNGKDNLILNENVYDGFRCYYRRD